MDPYLREIEYLQKLHYEVEPADIEITNEESGSDEDPCDQSDHNSDTEEELANADETHELEEENLEPSANIGTNRHLFYEARDGFLWCDHILCVKEKLISVQRTLTTNSETLLKVLIRAIFGLSVPKGKILVQCYDGRLSTSCEKPILTVHCLKLVLADLMKSVLDAFSFFGIIESLYCFIEGSATRHAVMEKII